MASRRGEGLTVHLRPATLDDAEIVFSWRNDPFIVARGSTQKTVTREEHLQWFDATTRASNRMLYIIEVNGAPAGQVRFDRVDARSCVVSAYLLEQHTGRGFGVDAIRQGCDRILQQWQVEEIVACVREDNGAGQSGFRKAGFMSADPDGRCPAGHREFIYRP